MLPASDSRRLYVPFVVKGRDRANTTRRSAAGLLALVENRHPCAGVPSSVGKLWTVSFLLFFEAVHGFSTERQRQ